MRVDVTFSEGGEWREFDIYPSLLENWIIGAELPEFNGGKVHAARYVNGRGMTVIRDWVLNEFRPLEPAAKTDA